jgi:hypothetical protein
MPFQNLAALKKLKNLGAEVVAIAPLESGRIVAAITTDPVQLSVHPYAGGSGKIVNVSLDEVNAAALIDKKVAVVKSGDDLWALLDIQHTPKMEQVGRDIKSLHACPAGGTALAIGWDGNGAALAFSNNEVGGRQFTLRGDVRTASLSSDNRCYVVVDAGGAGQYRTHPGTTPESGAIGRYDLPAETAGWELLAGGDELAALAKRGADSVCVIRKEGAAAINGKMIGVAGGVVDVAVISTTLFVLCADGNLRMYGADALQQAGIDPPPTTAELNLRCDGAPTTLTATSMGGAKLWIGSRSGDVITCAAVRGGLSV